MRVLLVRTLSLWFWVSGSGLGYSLFWGKIKSWFSVITLRSSMNTSSEGLQRPLEWRDENPGLRVLEFCFSVSGEKNSI